MGKTIGRKVVDISQKARGRQALRYEFEVIPYFCGDIPDDVDKVLFSWERGSKCFVTDPEPVNSTTHAVFWKQYLRQTATLYKEHNEFLPKEYSFKVQRVTVRSKGDYERKTVGKVHVDLAQYCTEHSDAQPQEVLLNLKPVGKLKCSIKATWLRNAKVDMDAMTEVTEQSGLASSMGQEEEELPDEQDLSGFDPETGQPLQPVEGDDDEAEQRRRRRRKRRTRRKDQPDDIPEGADAAEESVHHGEQASRHEATSTSGKHASSPTQKASRKQQPSQNQQHEPGGQADPSSVLDSGRQVQTTGLRDLLCCCLPRRGPQEDPLENDSLLGKKQKAVELRNKR